MPFPSWLPLLLGVLSAVGPLSTDMYLPAFPTMEASLGAAEGTAQITLATWFAGLAVGQLTQGTLSDRYGRRAPLIAGTALFTVCSIGCALAPDLATLAALRFVTAIGASASMVIPRAIIRDVTDGHGAARLLSQLMLIMGAAPILAPTIGGLILVVASWRTIFWIAAVYGALCCATVIFALTDTLPRERRVRLGFVAQAARYGAILTERGFITHVLMGGFAMFAMFAYLGGSPTVFIAIFHLQPTLYGALFGACAFGLILSSQINPRVLPRFGANAVIFAATRVAWIAAIVLLTIAVTRWGGWLAVAIPVAAIVGSQGFTMPNATVGALSRHAAHAGSASALMGTVQFSLGAVSGTLVGLLSDGSVRPMAGLMLFGTTAAVICDLCRPRAR